MTTSADPKGAATRATGQAPGDAVARLVRRDAALRAVRAFFHDRGFVEADTPQLVPGPGLEPHIDPLAVAVRTDLLSTATSPRWLITSPELALKRVVAAGAPRVFQLVHVFRDGERTARHSPEFTMLEWYRGPGTLDEILDDTVQLVRAVAAVVGNASGVDLSAAVERVSCADAFARAGVDLSAALDETAAGDVDALPRRVRATGDLLPGALGFDDAFFHVMAAHVEPSIGRERLGVVEAWPASMAVLARLDERDPRYARRFEVYAHGRAGSLELCNAFDELTDAREQRARFDDDNATRARLGKPVLPLDADFLAALPKMPSPSAGNALGFDRLLMLLTGAERIDDVLALPWR
ncbi:MAG: EF-P lysine aminoacylase GenX [Deltaproteobacteria bacterium]|nr:EF-P lysine aminoacylase GenX [Deltaproteobacteria bacterium]